ncbi:MAG: hypothetical protein HY544_04545 [Candidatus Diapherotrites archaeon]|uniref:Uncharacterized protein n=1 Tax=Candidatus Iainarchaeum sp. TaxID=3101447 RepID=A0A8T3YNA4_9ARCH|nr:hypothetical protein [Candidatus Diapherotrites archaeon]
MKRFVLPILFVFLAASFAHSSIVASPPLPSYYTIAYHLETLAYSPGLVKDVNNLSAFEPMIDSNSIATESGVLPEEQICISPGRLRGGSSFEVLEEGKVIGLKGNYRVSYRLLCDRQSELRETISDYSDADLASVDLVRECGFSPSTSRIGCVIVLTKAEPYSASDGSGPQLFLIFFFTILGALVLLPLALFFLSKDGSVKRLYAVKFLIWLALIAATILFPFGGSSGIGMLALLTPPLQAVLSLIARGRVKAHENGNARLICNVLLVLEVAAIILLALAYAFTVTYTELV